jgi:hypothetical protein
MKRTRIDPDTGVEVLTFAGYIAHEAERKGHSLEQEMEEYNRDMASMYDEEMKSLRENALDILQRAVRDENEWLSQMGEEPIAEPVEILEFRNVEPGGLGRHVTERIEAYVKRPDGTEGVICWTHEHYSGSYLEPPEDEVQIWWSNEV